MLRDELRDAIEPALRNIDDHPFAAGLRNGTLPGEVLVHFAKQDSEYVLPGYARAVARCAAIAPDHTHAGLLARMAHGTLEARQGMAMGFELAVDHLRLPADLAAATPEVDPTVLGYTSFMTAAAATSLAAGIGATLPMTWLYILTADDLRDRHVPASLYAGWIEALHPGEEYRELVEEVLGMVEEIGKQCSAYEREQLVRNVRYGARYEWSFIDAAWQLAAWPF